MSGHVRVLWTAWKQSMGLQFVIFTPPEYVCARTSPTTEHNPAPSPSGHPLLLAERSLDQGRGELHSPSSHVICGNATDGTRDQSYCTSPVPPRVVTLEDAATHSKPLAHLMPSPRPSGMSATEPEGEVAETLARLERTSQAGGSPGAAGPRQMRRFSAS
jgi:hypothetical protein